MPFNLINNYPRIVKSMNNSSKFFIVCFFKDSFYQLLTDFIIIIKHISYFCFSCIWGKVESSISNNKPKNRRAEVIELISKLLNLSYQTEVIELTTSHSYQTNMIFQWKIFKMKNPNLISMVLLTNDFQMSQSKNCIWNPSNWINSGFYRARLRSTLKEIKGA